MRGPAPWLSVVVPVLNEARTLPTLHARLHAVLDRLGRPWELLVVDDGSTDGSFELLRALRARDPALRVVRLDRNYGQHAAVLAGLSRARGEVVVTLDGDLQNPPEEIPRLLDRLAEGYELVAGYRVGRRDPWSRRLLSWGLNCCARLWLGPASRDWGCMLRAYRRPLVERMVASARGASFVPVLASRLARSAAEVPVGHAPRAAGRSRYGPARLLRLALALVAASRPTGGPSGHRRRPRYAVAEVLE